MQVRRRGVWCEMYLSVLCGSLGGLQCGAGAEQVLRAGCSRDVGGTTSQDRSRVLTVENQAQVLVELREVVILRLV